uniref:Long-chain specific acyl-CoA dehydrogenase, mitochondrial n=1 Tax=Phallusia mammillata TaxID=59560 RepID=A0A6F9D4W1_9ASCI|nr:long-chain specific acyl-CoA dehydrogenase, mitochondrial-like [Phallusia mammillata]
MAATLRAIRSVIKPNSPLNKLFSSSSASFQGIRLEGFQTGRFTDVGTRHIFNEDHDMFRESARKFFQEEVAPYHSEWEEAGHVSKEVWQKAGEMGLLGVNISDTHGGIGGDWLSAAIVHEEQGYVNCSGPGFALHSDIVMPYITNYGTPEQIAKYIPDMTAGKRIGAIAMTEPSAGSDLQGVRTFAKRDDDDWILNGSKVFITNGFMCDVVIVVAITDKDAKSAAHGISLFLVDADTPGFTKGKPLKKMGLKAQDTSELFFEDCRLPSSALLGGEAGLNKGFYQLMQELPQERLLIANLCMAACEFMFEETRDYVKQRKAFGKTLSQLQTIQHKLAEIKTETAVARAFLDQCNALHNIGKLDTSTASMAKYYITDLNNTVAYRCVQLHGGWGFMWEYPISRAYVDARVQTIYGGSNEIMKELIARQILKDP